MENKLKPIMDSEAVGTLTVDKGSSEGETTKKEVLRLPEMGKKFMLDGQEYIVCYINEGKKRFSAEPCSGKY